MWFSSYLSSCEIDEVEPNLIYLEAALAPDIKKTGELINLLSNLPVGSLNKGLPQQG